MCIEGWLIDLTPSYPLLLQTRFQDFSDVTYSSTRHGLQPKSFYSTKTTGQVTEERKEHSKTLSPPSSLSSAPFFTVLPVPYWAPMTLFLLSPRGVPSVPVLGSSSLTSMASTFLGSWETASRLCDFFFIYFCANNLDFPPRKN